ncbi:ACSF2 [Lepeophtheirus salmonis]|uniref:ACSF2 n=1 Tax=Lepeophtheirus salmonis TaxID=72036 RepID=A0A7R8H8R9_LEPSM|nr:ACSF2 [Lepeophtheirus salmonis]CAF2943357.1 ACSF2 [Lepeophtheirus salmonis]
MSFDPIASLNCIPAQKCTYLFGTPTMYVAVLEAQKKSKSGCKFSFKYEVLNEHIWGNRDRSNYIVPSPEDSFEQRLWIKMEKILPVNTPGEIGVRTPGLMHGYYEEQKSSQEAIGPDRYCHSGPNFWSML